MTTTVAATVLKHKLREQGARGGHARARKLSPERRLELARRAWEWRAGAKLSGMSRRALEKRLFARLEQHEPGLGEWVSLAWRSRQPIAVAMLDMLTDAARADVWRALEAVVIECVDAGDSEEA